MCYMYYELPIITICNAITWTADEKKEDGSQEAEFPEPVVRDTEDNNKDKQVDTSDDNALLMMLKMRRNESRKLNHAEVR